MNSATAAEQERKVVMRNKRWIIPTLAAVACSAWFGVMGCKPDADTPMRVEAPPTTTENGRIQVTRIGVIDDTLAYDNRRGIYIIKDSVTGKEYIGVSGIGISELGSHKNNKTTVSDER